jgi:hypothetical protein
LLELLERDGPWTDVRLECATIATAVPMIDVLMWQLQYMYPSILRRYEGPIIIRSASPEHDITYADQFWCFAAAPAVPLAVPPCAVLIRPT